VAVLTEGRAWTAGRTSAADCEVAVIGAGPHGLSAAVQLRRAGIETRVFGRCMSFWQTMPEGMLLRSNWSATNMVEPVGPLSLDAFKADSGARFETPVPLDRFVEYGEWVQRSAVADLDTRLVARIERCPEGFMLELEDGERLTAGRVVVACGIAPFAWRPPEFDHLPPELASHTSEHRDLSRFSGRRVAVVGGGQSALESAALMHEAGADVEVFIRRPGIVWLRGVGVKKRIGRLGPVVYAPTDVGPLWYSRLVAKPHLFRRLPRGMQDPISRRSIRPAGSHWVRERLGEVPLHTGHAVVAAAASGDGVALTLDGGGTHEADELVFGTGYRVDVARYPFLPASITESLRLAGGYPVLQRGLESSVGGLHFLGAPACWSFGPTQRFVSGSWFGAAELAAEVRAAARAGAAR
jgi:hypothetical protein